MKNIGFTIVSIASIGVLVVIGYFAFVSLSHPEDYVSETTDTLGDLYPITSEPTTPTPLPPDPVVVVEEELVVSEKPVSAHAQLQAELQKLLDAKTVLKVGSRGDAVGSIQKFMNLYFKKTSRVDNDFGKTTEADVKKFQSQNKLPQTGQVGTQGLTAMITWLKNN